MIQVTAECQVIYKTGDNRLGRFPEAASDDLVAGPKRNFQIFDPLGVLAEVTRHIPEIGEHLIRYYGWYSNKSRGQRAKAQPVVAVAELQKSGARPLGAWGQAGPQAMGRVDQAGLRGEPAGLSQVWGGNENHRVHRTPSERGDRKDSAAPWLMGGNVRKGSSTRPRASGGMKQLEGGQRRGARTGFREPLRTA